MRANIIATIMLVVALGDSSQARAVPDYWDILTTDESCEEQWRAENDTAFDATFRDVPWEHGEFVSLYLETRDQFLTFQAIRGNGAEDYTFEVRDLYCDRGCAYSGVTIEDAYREAYLQILTDMSEGNP